MQKYNGAQSSQKIRAIDLEYGQLGMVVNNNCLKNSIVTRMFGGLICVYSTNQAFVAFKSTWGEDGTLMVRVLSNEESVVLSNE